MGQRVSTCLCLLTCALLLAFTLALPQTYAATNELTNANVRGEGHARLQVVLDDVLAKLPEAIKKELPAVRQLTCEAWANPLPALAWPWYSSALLQADGTLRIDQALCGQVHASAPQRVLWLSLASACTAFASQKLAAKFGERLNPYLFLVGLERDPAFFFRLRQFERPALTNANRPRPHSVSQALAFDLPLYLADPLFSCRRPASAEQLAELFGPSPVASGEGCTVFNLVPLTGYRHFLNAELEFAALEPDELMEVDYVFVTGGSRLSQRFGHALLKLSFCPVGEDPAWCRLQLDQQYALSYRGVEQMGSRSGKGLEDMHGFVMPWRDILLEYSSKDQRTMKAYPLDLDKQARRRLLLAFLERSATSNRPYQVLASNCATALVTLLNTVRLGSPISLAWPSPAQLVQSLKSAGLITKKPELIPPSRLELKRYLQDIQALLGERVVLADLQQAYEKRHQVWEAMLAQAEVVASPSVRARALSLVMHIENIMLRYAEAAAASKLKKALFAEPCSQEQKPTAAQRYQQAILQIQSLQVEADPKGTTAAELYGLPTPQELAARQGDQEEDEPEVKVQPLPGLEDELEAARNALIGDELATSEAIRHYISRLFQRYDRVEP